MCMTTKSVTIAADKVVLKAIDELAMKRKRSRSFLYNEAAEMLLANHPAATPPPPTTKKKAGTR